MRRCLKVRANCSSSSRSLGSSGWDGGSKHLGGCGCERCGSGSVGRVTAWWGGQVGGMQDGGPGWGSVMARQSPFPPSLPAFQPLPAGSLPPAPKRPPPPHSGLPIPIKAALCCPAWGFSLLELCRLPPSLQTPRRSCPCLTHSVDTHLCGQPRPRLGGQKSSLGLLR